VIRRCPWKDRAVAPLFRFEISLLGERHGRWFRPIGSRCRDGHCALSSRCQLRDLNFVGFDWSTLRFSGRRSAKCQRSCGGGCAQEVTASGFSELIVRHEASPMCLLTLPTYRLSFCREVVPEIVEALGAAKEGGEDREVRQDDVASTRAGRRHPEEAIEFSVPRLDERMWPSQIDRLARKNPNCDRIIRCQRIMRQVLWEGERLDGPWPTRP